VAPQRCLDCQKRFISRTVFPEDAIYAHCPRCGRMDLAEWKGKRFKPSGWTKLKTILRAHKWRCDYCQLNFASFRDRKEVSVFGFGPWKQPTRTDKSRRTAEGNPESASGDRSDDSPGTAKGASAG